MIDFAKLETAVKRLNSKIVIEPNSFQAVYTIYSNNIGTQIDNLKGDYITNLIRLDKYEEILLAMQDEKNYETQKAVDNLTDVINHSSIFLKYSDELSNPEPSSCKSYTITVRNRGAARLIKVGEEVSLGVSLKKNSENLSNSSTNILTYNSLETYQNLLKSIYLSIKITKMSNFSEQGKHDLMLEKLNKNADFLEGFMTKHGITFNRE